MGQKHPKTLILQMVKALEINEIKNVKLYTETPSVSAKNTGKPQPVKVCGFFGLATGTDTGHF